MRRLLSAFCLTGFCAVFFCGCNSTRFMVDSMVPVTEKMNAAVNRNTDIQLVGEAIPAGILQLEGLLAVSPDNPKILLQVAEAYYGYAYAFLEEVDPERAGRMYEKSYTYAMRVLEKNKAFAGADDKSLEAFDDSLSALGKEDVPALFYAASSRLSWIGVHLDNPEVFLILPRIKSMSERIVELDETVYYGGAHALLGVYHASRAPVTGGDPQLAKAHFDRAFEISGGRFLPFYLLYAEFYAYQIQDRDLFVQTLEGVLEKSADIMPERAFINSVAREKAAVMLETADDLF